MSEKVTVVGSGLVGRCWAIVFARGGLDVIVYDSFPNQLSLAKPDIQAKLQALKEAKLLKGQSPEDILKRISYSDNIKEATKGSIYVQECVPEHIDIKKKVFAELDEVTSPNTILASSTSSMPCSRFTETLKHRNRCIVSHPINPPHVIPLVEIIPAPWTDAEVVNKTRELMLKVGNAPVVLKKEIPGFVQNRLQYALLAEAFRLVEDGVMSPEDVDTTVIHGLAARWSFIGPFQTIDLNAPRGVSDYCQRYLGGIYSVLKQQDNSREYSAETVKKVDEHFRKQYTAEEIPKVAEWRDRRLMALASHQEEAKKINTLLPNHGKSKL
jgi:L-gulonate 3-dehydrogenase